MKKECGFCDEVGGLKNVTALPILSGSCEGWRYSSSLCRAITLLPGTHSSLKFSDWCPLHPSASIKLEGVMQTRCACSCFSVNLLQEEISWPEHLAELRREVLYSINVVKCIPHLSPACCPCSSLCPCSTRTWEFVFFFWVHCKPILTVRMMDY